MSHCVGNPNVVLLEVMHEFVEGVLQPGGSPSGESGGETHALARSCGVVLSLLMGSRMSGTHTAGGTKLPSMCAAATTQPATSASSSPTAVHSVATSASAWSSAAPVSE